MTEATSGAPPAATRDALHSLCLSDPLWAERYDGWADLGRGGSATVVRVRSRDAEAEIAVKVFFGLTSDGRQRFGREVHNAQCLTSPNIVRTLSPFVRGSLAWIEMELVEGPDLRQELERRLATQEPLPLAQAVEIASAVAEALRTAHTAGVVHRDVKPANVLLPKEGRPAAKLGDFGIARIVGSTRVTATGLLAGTPQFAAPEVVSGHEAGPASDVYGLALCLYLMLSGNRFPFDVPEGASPAQWLRAHADIDPRPVTTFRVDLPVDLVRLVTHGLSKDPARRPSLAEFLETLAPHRLGPLSRGLPVAAGRPRESGPFWAPIVAGLVGLSLGLGASHWMTPAAPRATPASRPSPSPSLAPTATSTATPPSPTPTAGTPAVVGVGVQEDLVTLLNQSAATLAGLRITLVASDGTRHVAEIDERLAPGEELLLALDDFAPRPASGLRPARVEVTLARPAGQAGVTTVMLPQARRP